jgi:hypothetical protein
MGLLVMATLNVEKTSVARKRENTPNFSAFIGVLPPFGWARTDFTVARLATYHIDLLLVVVETPTRLVRSLAVIYPPFIWQPTRVEE